MTDRDGVPLWVHVMLGVATGTVLAGVVLYWLWAWHMRVQMDAALAELQRVTTEVRRNRPSNTSALPMLSPSASSPVKAVGCEPGHALGQVNGRSVCVDGRGEVHPLSR